MFCQIDKLQNWQMGVQISGNGRLYKKFNVLDICNKTYFWTSEPLGNLSTNGCGVLTQDGGVLTQDGGVLSPLSPYPLPSEAKAKQADVRLNTIICCAFLRVHIFPKKQKMNLFLPFLAPKSWIQLPKLPKNCPKLPRFCPKIHRFVPCQFFRLYIYVLLKPEKNGRPTV